MPKKGYKQTKEHIKKLGKVRKGKTFQEMGHKPNCPCCFCRNKRGEQKGKNNPMYRIGKNHPQYKHGGSGTRLMGIWIHIKARCRDKNNKAYGTKGITVCPEWLDKEKGFINFRDFALSHSYNDSLTIDRIDNDGNYEPSNCQFLTRSENSIKGNKKGEKK